MIARVFDVFFGLVCVAVGLALCAPLVMAVTDGLSWMLLNHTLTDINWNDPMRSFFTLIAPFAGVPILVFGICGVLYE